MTCALTVMRSMSMSIGLVAVVTIAQAHKASDAYLQINASDQELTVRWDIALRDLDVALDLDLNEDGKLTWGEVKIAWPRIQNYALNRLAIDGCALNPIGRALERRDDGAYAVIELRSDCVVSKLPEMTYTLLREVDPTHRGIAKFQRAGQPLALTLLDPGKAVRAQPSDQSAENRAAKTVIANAAESAANAEAKSVPDAKLKTEGVTTSAISFAIGTDGFLGEGIRHILTGYDHVLFLLCLLLPSVLRRTSQGWQPVTKLKQAVWPIAGIVTAFTVAHSITLALAATKTMSLSPALIEPAITLTIILAAIDNLRPFFPVPRAVVAFCFGLIHGFGFASVLAELNLPAMDFAWALLKFNIGLEAGQLLIVVAAASILFLLRQLPGYVGWVLRGGSVTAMLLAAFWMVERTTGFWLTRFY